MYTYYVWKKKCGDFLLFLHLLNYNIYNMLAWITNRPAHNVFSTLDGIITYIRSEQWRNYIEGLEFKVTPPAWKLTLVTPLLLIMPYQDSRLLSET